MIISPDESIHCAALLSQRLPKLNQRTETTPPDRICVFTLLQLDNSSACRVLYRRPALHLFTVIKKSPDAHVTAHTLNVCVCRSNKAANKMHFCAHMKEYSCTKLRQYRVDWNKSELCLVDIQL